MRGFILSWLKLKRARPKLWLNSPRFCWQGGKEVWQEGCACVCVHMWGSSYFLDIIHKIIYRINVIKIYISKKEGKAWKCETLNTIYVNFVLSIVALIIHRPHGGVCVSAFCHLTSWQQGGCIKEKNVYRNVGSVRMKNCTNNCWECSHESWLGQQIRYIHD